jgi:hypothetical protein
MNHGIHFILIRTAATEFNFNCKQDTTRSYDVQCDFHKNYNIF